MWRWWTLQYGCYCHAVICRVSNCCLSSYLHVAGTTTGSRKILSGSWNLFWTRQGNPETAVKSINDKCSWVELESWWLMAVWRQLWRVVWRQLKNANSLLDECQQPYQYLIESIRKRDEEIGRLRQTLHTLDADLRFGISWFRPLDVL